MKSVFVFLVSFVAVFLTINSKAFTQGLDRTRFEAAFDAFDFNQDNQLSADEVMLPCANVDLVVGARGNSLQLVLNSIYGIGSPVENIPWQVYADLSEGRNDAGQTVKGKLASYVEFAMPLCIGDYYGKYQVLGTTNEIFEKYLRVNLDPENQRPVKFSSGEKFAANNYFAAVVGARVAKSKKLNVGDHINFHHGFAKSASSHVHEQAFRITGILETTFSPADRQLFVNMEGFFLLEDHAKPLGETDGLFDNDDKSKLEESTRKGNVLPNATGSSKTTDDQAPLPIEQREVTALLIKCHRDDDDFGVSQFALQHALNANVHVQAVSPTAQLHTALESLSAETILYLLGRGFQKSDRGLRRSEWLEIFDK